MREKIGLFMILSFGAFLLFYKLNTLMMFIGDFAWFYISARDMLLTGNIPLVGITSSHPWLHQGPFWTYMLAFAFSLSHFHPLSGGYLAASIGVLTIFTVYFVGSHVFSQRTGIIAAILYATSPLVIIFARMPYHTTPIPIFSCLSFYALCRWVKGDIRFFPVLLFLFAVLYNFELATILLVFAAGAVFLYGWRKKLKWVKGLKNRKIISFAIAGVCIPLIPILFYDTRHMFTQTVGFGIWIVYKLLKTPISLFVHHPATSQESIPMFLKFLFLSNQRFLFIPNGFIALGLVILLSGYFMYEIAAEYKNKKISIGKSVLAAYLGISFLGFLGMHTVSEAYVPMFFPLMIFVFAVTVNIFFEKRQFVTIIIFTIIALTNVVFLLKNDYLMNKENGYGVFFHKRVQIARQIVETAKGRRYTIRGEGNGSQFRTFTMGDEYLTWWMGRGPSNTPVKLRFTVFESPTKLQITKIQQ